MNQRNMIYSEETIAYIDSIKASLIERYGAVKPEWELMIDLLADNVEQYKQVMATINEVGIWNYERGVKNPLLSTAKDLQASIFKQVQHIGCSPYSISKIKTTAEDDTDDFLEVLCGDVEKNDLF